MTDRPKLVAAITFIIGGSLAIVGIGIGLESWAALGRALLALPLLLFVPGYTAVRCVCGDKLGGLDLAALTSGLSMALVVICGLFLHYSGLMSETGWAISLGSISLVAHSVMRLRGIPLLPCGDGQIPGGSPRQLACFGGAFLIAVAAILVARADALSHRSFLFTEFWLLPDHIRDEAHYTVGITNYEGVEATYDVDVMVDDHLVEKRSGIRLRDGENFITEVYIRLGSGKGPRLEAWLFKNGNRDAVYRRVWSTAANTAGLRTNNRVSTHPPGGLFLPEPGFRSRDGVRKRARPER
jgi:hypothetical protein